MSMRQQFVKIRQFVGTARDFGALDHALFDYERQLAQWAEAFGKPRVFVSEDGLARPERMTGVYLEAMGLGDMVADAERMGSSNESLHPYAAEFLRLTH